MKRKAPGPVADENLNDMSSPLRFLQTRRSSLAKDMTGPGPDEAQLALLIETAVRVPDHGKLAPWRFIVFSGQGRTKAGDILADAWQAANPSHGAETLAMQRATFERAPVVVAVVSSVVASPKIPAHEQELSAGALCYNLVLAAIAMGFGAQWITGWYASDRGVLERFGLAEHEKIAGYIYIGQPAHGLSDRPRPDAKALVTRFGDQGTEEPRAAKRDC